MNRSDALVVVAFFEATYRLKDGLMPTEKSVWLGALADVDEKEDALRAIDRIAKGGRFPPTAQEVAELAQSTIRVERITAEREGRELEAPPDTRPECCQRADEAFTHWLDAHASAAERKKARRLGVGKAVMPGA